VRISRSITRIPTVAESERAAKVEQCPDDRCRREQPIEGKSKPQRDNSKGENEHRCQQDRDGENDEVDDKGHDPARQNALEQFRLGGWIVGVWFDIDRHYASSRCHRIIA
jgi:hypothetical protein